MKLKYKIAIEILLVIVSLIVCVYNFVLQREIVYISSIIAVIGTIALLIKEILKAKENTEDLFNKEG